ncbi:MAG: fluoride efflux transporter CrcB [Rhodospirillaceae bacterium]
MAQAWMLAGAAAAGGAMGSAARWAMVAAVGRLMGPGFPYGTMVVNILGSFLMGMLIDYLAFRGPIPEPVRVLLVTGVLGGFTTFSTFSLDLVFLIERGAWVPAFGYLFGSVLLGVAGLMAGMALCRQILA